MYKTTKTLPKKPSALINLALKDIEAVEQKPGVFINMATWFTRMTKNFYRDQRDPVPVQIKTCEVCFAGAVMMNTLGVGNNGKDEYSPHDLSKELRNKLHALDAFRSGDVYDGLLTMGFHENVANRFGWRQVPDYIEDKEGFKKAMRRLISDLKRKGL
jgi:hypothetical protein